MLPTKARRQPLLTATTGLFLVGSMSCQALSCSADTHRRQAKTLVRATTALLTAKTQTGRSAARQRLQALPLQHADLKSTRQQCLEAAAALERAEATQASANARIKALEAARKAQRKLDPNSFRQAGDQVDKATRLLARAQEQLPQCRKAIDALRFR